MSKELATIKLDVELDLKPEQLILAEPDDERLAELYKQCEFRRWLGEATRKRVSNQRNMLVLAMPPRHSKTGMDKAEGVNGNGKDKDARDANSAANATSSAASAGNAAENSAALAPIDRSRYVTITDKDTFLADWLKRLQQADLFRH